MFNYFVVERPGGERRQIAPDKVDAFFRGVESVTGLDRSAAEAILHGGLPINHPDYIFLAWRMNPFDPVRII